MAARSLLLLLLLSLWLTGCAPVQPAAHDQLVISAPSGRISAALSAAVDEYQRQTGEQAQVAALSPDSYANRIAGLLLAGRGDDDILYLPSAEARQFEAYHALQPLPGSPTRAFVPAELDALVLVYRADWFDQAGLAVPTSMSGLLSAARAFTHPPDRYGLALAGSQIDAGADFAPYLLAFNDQLAPALAFYAALRAPDGVALPGSERASRSEVINALRDGRAAMGILPLSLAQELLGAAPAQVRATPTIPPVPLPFKAAALPGLTGKLAGSTAVWAVPRNAAQPLAARRFLEWFETPAGQLAWVKGGGLPASPSALTDPAILAYAPYLFIYEGGTPVSAELADILGAEQPAGQYSQSVHQMMSGEISEDEALSLISALVNQGERQP